MTVPPKKRKPLELVAILIPVILVAAGILVYDYEFIGVGGTLNPHYTSFTVGDKTFALTYVATNQSALAKGLMKTKVVATTTMLFVFPNASEYSFWMYDVNTSLDIMWVYVPPGSSSGVFVYLVQDAPPCQVPLVCTTYTPTARANFVIEAEAGFAELNGISVGTPVTIN